MHTISDSGELADAELIELYSSVGWMAYAADPENLRKAIVGSSYVVTARGADGVLIGLARAISDDATIAYVQDILVRPSVQRLGAGRAMVEKILERYRHIRQIVLLTDDWASQRAFYESMAFVEAHDFEPSPLRAFVRIA